MTDRFADINAIGELNRNPITNAGRVAQNGYLWVDEIEERKSNHKSRKSCYEGPTDDTAFYVFPRDICLAERTFYGLKNKAKMMSPYVLSVANGGFKKGEKLWEIIEKLDFKGVAGGQGAKYDSSGRNPEVDFALVLGGLVTLANTGGKRIKNGDLVYWSLPDPKNPYENARSGSERMPYISLPYDPTLDELNQDTIKDILCNGRNRRSEWNQETRWPIVEGATLFGQSMKVSIILAAHILAGSGLFVFDEEAFKDQKKRERNSITYMKDEKKRLEIHNSIAYALGILESSQSEQNKLKFKFNGAQKETTLEEFAIDVFLGTNESALIFPLASGTKTIPGGNKGQHIKNQKGWVSDIFAAIARANMFVTRRIFAKAITSAEPGKEYDAYLGHYSS